MWTNRPVHRPRNQQKARRQKQAFELLEKEDPKWSLVCFCVPLCFLINHPRSLTAPSFYRSKYHDTFEWYVFSVDSTYHDSLSEFCCPLRIPKIVRPADFHCLSFLLAFIVLSSHCHSPHNLHFQDVESNEAVINQQWRLIQPPTPQYPTIHCHSFVINRGKLPSLERVSVTLVVSYRCVVMCQVEAEARRAWRWHCVLFVISSVSHHSCAVISSSHTLQFTDQWSPHRFHRRLRRCRNGIIQRPRHGLLRRPHRHHSTIMFRY